MRRTRAASILLVILFFSSAPAPASGRFLGLKPLKTAEKGPEASQSWFSPIPLDGKVFPVLSSAEGRWLNWRDTYGAPRMRQQPDGVWRQTGVHQGIDIFTERGAPVVAMTAGKVERAGWTFYSGWRIGVRGSDGRYYFYAHLLQDFAAGIAEGASVRAGQALGRVGSSGYGPVGTSDEFPPHLHIGIQAGTQWQNPEPLLRKLYLHTTASIKTVREQVLKIDSSLRALKARPHLPAAPAAPDLAARIAALTAERRELLRQATLSI